MQYTPSPLCRVKWPSKRSCHPLPWHCPKAAIARARAVAGERPLKHVVADLRDLPEEARPLEQPELVTLILPGMVFSTVSELCRLPHFLNQASDLGWF